MTKGDIAQFNCTVVSLDDDLVLDWYYGEYEYLYRYSNGHGNMLDRADTNKFSVEQYGTTFTLNINTDAMTDGNRYTCYAQYGSDYYRIKRYTKRAQLLVFGK